MKRDARGGSRYIEILKSHFGVTSPDARLQRPEYLGGNRVPININQVVQQSATASGETAQGTVTGMSLTSDSHSDFIKSFTEHGFVIGVCCVRHNHSYQQGLERFWSRTDRPKPCSSKDFVKLLSLIGVTDIAPVSPMGVSLLPC